MIESTIISIFFLLSIIYIIKNFVKNCTKYNCNSCNCLSKKNKNNK